MLYRLLTLPLLAAVLIGLGCEDRPAAVIDVADATVADATVADATVADAASQASADSLYELRIYYPAEGRQADLLARFRDHTTALFERHGMTNIGYWAPIDPADDRLIYVLAFPDTTARREAWEGFLNDPDWISAYEASRTNGPLVERIESTLLTPTDFSALR